MAAAVQTSLPVCYLVLFIRCMGLIYISQLDTIALGNTQNGLLAGSAELSATAKTPLLLQGMLKGQVLLHPEYVHGHRRTDHTCSTGSELDAVPLLLLCVSTPKATTK